MAGFSASAAMASGFRLIGRHPGVVLTWGAAYLVVAMAPLLAVFWGDLPALLGLYSKIMRSLMAGAVPTANDPELVSRQGLMIAFEMSQLGLNLLAAGLVSCAVYRAVLEPERKAFAYLRVGLQEFWVMASMLALGVLLIALMIASSAAVGLIAQTVGAGSWLGGLLLFLASCGAFALVIWVALRLSMAAPMSFAERRFRLTEAWPLTHGQGWRLFAVALGLASLILLIQMVLATLGQALGVGAPLARIEDLQGFVAHPAANLARLGPALASLVVMQILVSAFSFTLWAAPFAEIYRELTAPGPAKPA
jgi:hypothetical protein